MVYDFIFPFLLFICYNLNSNENLHRESLTACLPDNEMTVLRPFAICCKCSGQQFREINNV